MLKNLKTKLLGIIAIATAAAASTVVHAQATVPTVVQTAIDDNSELMTVTGTALLAILVVVLGFNWLRRVMK